MSPESRLPHWTDHYFEDRPRLLENSSYGIFSQKQKLWLVNAWTEFCRGRLPDVFAVHRHKCGLPISSWTINPKQIEWHHIIPGQDCLAHSENPDLPENAIPLPKKNHTGVSKSPIHPDISEAKSLWGNCIDGQIENPFANIRKNHADAAAKGFKYWDDSYDEFFLDLASRVVSTYRQKHPELPWPVPKRRSTIKANQP